MDQPPISGVGAHIGQHWSVCCSLSDSTISDQRTVWTMMWTVWTVWTWCWQHGDGWPGARMSVPSWCTPYLAPATFLPAPPPAPAPAQTGHCTLPGISIHFIQLHGAPSSPHWRPCITRHLHPLILPGLTDLSIRWYFAFDWIHFSLTRSTKLRFF